MTTERRQSSRMPSFLGARIHMRHLNSTYDCIVRNLSDAGGRLVMPAPTFLPETFDLYITQRDEMHRARIVWRNDRHVGVRFEQHERDVEPISLEKVRRLKKLEAERELLKRRIEDLSGGA